MQEIGVSGGRGRLGEYIKFCGAEPEWAVEVGPRHNSQLLACAAGNWMYLVLSCWSSRVNSITGGGSIGHRVVRAATV